MKNGRNKFEVPYLIVIGILMIALFCFVGFFTDFRPFLAKDYPADMHDFSQDWSLEDGEVINIYDTDA
ncbi:MAG: hypothetical protein IJU25_02760, partial [Lachnospiraceae bacterium]|nr:hypothetical protein [Lachnospiraceae bacterium]